MPVPAPQQHTENWVFGPFLLHRSEWGHYVLYGPEAVTSEPFEFLAGFGIDNQWTCEWESMDGIVITHLFHPDFFPPDARIPWTTHFLTLYDYLIG